MCLCDFCFTTFPYQSNSSGRIDGFRIQLELTDRLTRHSMPQFLVDRIRFKELFVPGHAKLENGDRVLPLSIMPRMAADIGEGFDRLVGEARNAVLNETCSLFSSC